MDSNRSFTGRSIGAVSLLPFADKSKPFIVIGANERGGSAYPLPALELRAEEGGEDGTEAGLVTCSYADHLGGVTALCAGKVNSHASATPAFLLAGSDRGALSLYPVTSSGESGVPPMLGAPPPSGGENWSPATTNGAPVFRGFWSSAAGGWASGAASKRGDGAGAAPVVGLALSRDSARAGVLLESGLLTVHALAGLGGPALASFPSVDSLDARGLCWRGDGDRSLFTVGAQHLKLWDVATGGRDTRPVLHIGDRSLASSPCSYTSVAVPPGDQDKVVCGTSDGRIVVWDLRMPGTSAHAVACKTAHPPLPFQAGGAHNSATRDGGGGMFDQFTGESGSGRSAAGVACLEFHPADPTVLFSGGGDDGCMVLNNLSADSGFYSSDSAIDDGGFAGGRSASWRTVLAGPAVAGGDEAYVPPACVAIAFDAETNFLAAAFDNEALTTIHRHPRLGRGGRFM